MEKSKTRHKSKHGAKADCGASKNVIYFWQNFLVLCCCYLSDGSQSADLSLPVCLFLSC